MAGTFLNYPFDEELFSYQWGQERDLVTDAMLNSGAVITDSDIANKISNGSDIYTTPFYKALSGAPVNYDGSTDITTSETSGDYLSGVVYGRAKGFKAKDFIADFNSGADPMSYIVSKVAKYWQDNKQTELLGILSAIFGINSGTYATAWADHTSNIAVTTETTPTAANKLADASVAEAAQKALGQFSNEFSLAVMHSKVAMNLAALQLLQYRKYTDINGIERTLAIADINGFTVVIDDDVPVVTNSTSHAVEYTTYLLGLGSIRTADAPVDHPATTSRDEATNGGEETLWTRQRQTILPNGFSFKKPSSGYTSSPTTAQLSNKVNWEIKRNPKEIAIASIVSNG